MDPEAALFRLPGKPIILDSVRDSVRILHNLRIFDNPRIFDNLRILDYLVSFIRNNNFRWIMRQKGHPKSSQIDALGAWA